jgi:hypothetical protein
LRADSSDPPSVQAVDQAGEHAGVLFQNGPQSGMPVGIKEILPRTKGQQRDTFLDAAAGDAEEVPAVGLRESPVALGNVCGDREGGAVELIGEEEVAARKAAGQRAYGVREVERLLVDKELFEVASPAVCSTLFSLRSPALVDRKGRHSRPFLSTRGDWI